MRQRQRRVLKIIQKNFFLREKEAKSGGKGVSKKVTPVLIKDTVVLIF
jgi:hypothetical protein